MSWEIERVHGSVCETLTASLGIGSLSVLHHSFLEHELTPCAQLCCTVPKLFFRLTFKTMGLNVLILHVVTVTKDLPSSPSSRSTIFNRDASSVLLQLLNQWLNFTYSVLTLSATEEKNKNSDDKNRTHDFRTSRCAGYLLDHSGDE